MRCARNSLPVAEIAVEAARHDDVRALLRRCRADEAAFALGLEQADRGTAWVARDDSEPVGLALAHDSGDERYVGALYVEPSYRGQDVGRRLLGAAFADAEAGARSLLLDGDDRAGVVLALRAGLAPLETLLNVAGAIPSENALLPMAAGDYRFEVDAIDPVAHEFELRALDRETRGAAHDHARLAAGAAGLAFFIGGEFVAYAYVWQDGRVGPIASASTAYLVQIYAYALASLQRTHGASWCTALIPGRAVRLLRAALRAGLRVERTFSLAADAPLPDASRYVGFHRLIL